MKKRVADLQAHLPEAIAAYLAADEGDSEAFSRCFAEHAVVQDEGRTYSGLAAIKQWKMEAKKKYQ